MNIHDNTILIPGGRSGIGRALAEAFHALNGNPVIIEGRRNEAPEETARANPGMKSMALDIESASNIRALAKEMEREFPTLDVAINTHPMATEICVKKVKPMRSSAESGHYEAIFNGLNEAMAAAAAH